MDLESKKNLTRMTIQVAAVKLFSENQYAEVTMDDIAAEAHLTKRTLYKYHPSKLSLLSSVFESYMQEEYVALSNAVRGCTNYKEAIIAVAVALYDYTKKNLRFMRLIWSINDEMWGKGLPEEILERFKSWNEALLNIRTEAAASICPTGVLAQFPMGRLNQFISAVNKGIFIQAQKMSNLGAMPTSTDELFQIALVMYEKCLDEG